MRWEGVEVDRSNDDKKHSSRKNRSKVRVMVRIRMTERREEESLRAPVSNHDERYLGYWTSA
jgi:hypothetical protein